MSPQSFLRRSPVLRTLQRAGARWVALADVALADAAIAESVGAADPGSLAIVDLSPLPRLGFKGRDTLAAIRARGVVCEARPNRAFVQPNGGLCLVLAATEVMLLSGLDGDGGWLARLATEVSLDGEERCYSVPRRDSHAWFAVAGEAAPAMFAKLCGVDLRPAAFAELAIAQTSVARLNGVVVRADADGSTVLHVLADSASAVYLLDCLLDAAQEFDGRLAGREVLRAGAASGRP